MRFRATLILLLALAFTRANPASTEPFFAPFVSPDAMAAFDTRNAGRNTRARTYMVAAANPLAVEAGTAILARGGTAADAMVAVQAVLGLVEPQSSGLGGGAFLIWYDAQTGTVTTLDGRETAPLAVTPRLFQTPNGETLGFFDAVVGGRSVGVPATPHLMAAAHARWGRAQWDTLFERAITLADGGFAISPRLADMIAFDRERLATQPATAAYFLTSDGQPRAVGSNLRNPAYAETLRALARDGADVFARGPIAEAIVAAVQGAPTPGLLAPVDLAIYRVKERAAVCVPYRGHRVCGIGPPSSGGLTVGQILGLLEPFDLAALGPDSPDAWRLFGDASRLAFADRGRYMADSDFVPVPQEALLAPDYLRSRASLLATDRALTVAPVGQPGWDHSRANDESIELPSTSHISIVDSYGNALSMTTTVENIFGSRLLAAGFILNNELTDFSFRTHRNGIPIANSVAPGKRPRSSMSPTIVLRDGRPILVIGSPGGSRIIGYVAKTIVAHLDWGLGVQAAI
ncbi:MAG: gamma-glutamyltransferase family protein, partial [Pseudomonadota bacterium]